MISEFQKEVKLQFYKFKKENNIKISDKNVEKMLYQAFITGSLFGCELARKILEKK